MTTVLLHPDVEQQLSNLPNDVESRVRSKLDDAGTNPERQLKPLRGREEYSLRIGKRRAIVDWLREENELRVLAVDTRDTIYD